jgi:hypothetical protein
MFATKRMAMLPSTTDRVPRHTASEMNQRIQQQIEENVRYFSAHPHQIPARLNELDHEWDIERTLEANAATVGLAGVLLGAFVDRRLLALPAAVMAFLLQHALQGWCPPVPFFRSRGVRTANEIDQEKYALKALRGDFDKMRDAADASGWAAASAALAAKAQQAVEATRG